VGKRALDGLNGVIDVTRGFSDGQEIVTVLYNPNRITPDDMVAALKSAGTYIGTAGP
jgi:hypothetical protein